MTPIVNCIFRGRGYPTFRGYSTFRGYPTFRGRGYPHTMSLRIKQLKRINQLFHQTKLVNQKRSISAF